jgi:hypothetical protein
VIPRLVFWIAAGLLVAIPPACSQGASGDFEREFRRDMDTVAQDRSKGLFDKAAIMLEDAATRAERAGRPDLAVEALIEGSNVAIRQNLVERSTDLITRAAQLSDGTPLEIVARFYLRLTDVESAIESKDYVGALDLLGLLYRKLPQVLQEKYRNNLESILLSHRQKIQLRLIAWIETIEQEEAASLDVLFRQLLEVLLTENPGLTPGAVRGNPAWLASQRPWRKRALEVCLAINQRSADVDREAEDEATRDILTGIDLDERGTIYQMLGQIDDAVRAKRSALEIFKRRNSSFDEIVASEHLALILETKGDPDSLAQAYRYSRDLIGLLESQTFVQVGQTVGEFLQGYRAAYELHTRLLWKRYLAFRGASRAIGQEALNEYLIHADRFVFRPVRRDLAVYYDVGATIGAAPALRARLEQSLKVVQAAEEEYESFDGSGAKGQTGAAFGEASPALRRQVAAHEFVTALEDIKRHETVSVGIDPTITRFLRNTTQGMDQDDGVLEYVEDPDGNLYAVLLRPGDSQIFPLLTGAVKQLGAMVPQVRKRVGADASAILAKLSTILLAPLPPLPQRLTVVLSPLILGVPFEALALPDGRLLVDEHQVRYAFGLYPKLGERLPRTTIHRAFIIGAESFADKSAAPLPDSRKEIDGIRTLLANSGAEVQPSESMPLVGNGLITDSTAYQVLHISTHSRLDTTIPILDALLFPHGRIYAHEMALAPIRSSLVVLSACELYRARGDRLYPVSGLTIAALARIAPQIISPLWETNARATSLFMMRFYSLLAANGDATLALARTKRDFAGGEGLRSWIRAMHLPDILDGDIVEYRKPFYWAPFVLSIGVSRDPESTGKT